MTLVQNEGRDAEIDRVMRGIITHCNARVDGIPPSEHAARRDLAIRMLDSVDGDESLVNFNDPAPEFATELHRLSLNKTLT
jgi:hypothetical protein